VPLIGPVLEPPGSPAHPVHRRLRHRCVDHAPVAGPVAGGLLRSLLPGPDELRRHLRPRHRWGAEQLTRAPRPPHRAARLA